MKEVPEFCAPSYLDRTANNLQRMQNFVPEKTPEGWKLVSYPGYQYLNAFANNAACRGAFYTSTGRLFSVNGNTVYEYGVGGSITSRGTISTSSGIVYFADNGLELLIVVDGVNGYTVTLSSGAPTLIADANFPSSPRGAAFIDGYFVVCKGSSGQFYLSQLYDGTDWTPIQFATAEYAGDSLYAVKRLGSQLYLFGTQTVEVWSDTGNASFPFERVNGATINVGLGGQVSLAVFKDVAYFVGSSQAGQRPIYALSQAGLKKISTPYIESLIWNMIVPAWDGYCFSNNGHDYYALQNGSNGGVLVYDITYDCWMENVLIGTTYPLKLILNCFDTNGEAAYAFSNSDGSIYEVKRGYNSLNGSNITRSRTFGPIGNGTSRLFHSAIRFVFEAQFDSTPSTTFSGLSIDWTDDDGYSYATAVTPSVTITATTNGQLVTVEARRLGMSPKRYYRITCTGAAQFIFQGCYLDAQQGPG